MVNYTSHSKHISEKPIHVLCSPSFDHLTEKETLKKKFVRNILTLLLLILCIFRENFAVYFF